MSHLQQAIAAANFASGLQAGACGVTGWAPGHMAIYRAGEREQSAEVLTGIRELGIYIVSQAASEATFDPAWALIINMPGDAELQALKSFLAAL